MTHQEFEQLVTRIETQFAQQAGRLRARVLIWAFLGYFSFLAWFLLLLLCAAAFIVPGCYFWPDSWFLILIGGIILIVGSCTLIRTLQLSIEPPKGRRVTRTELPALFQCLDTLQASCQARPFDGVFITTAFNAGVIEEPRLGVFGWWKKHLIIGLPLLDLLDEEEIRSVLAHEFAHLSAGHAREGHWIYRLRRSWENLFNQYRDRPVYKGEISTHMLLRKYLYWFWPRFNAHAFVFSRSCEYDADALAARITGPARTATALARIRIYSQVIYEKFWPEIWLLARKTEEPPNDIFDRLRQFVSTATAGNVQALYSTALQGVTTNADTHPCLAERIKALLFDHDLPLAGSQFVPASRSLLGSAEPGIRRELNDLWRSECNEEWKRLFARAISLEHRLQSIPANDADAEAIWDKARTAMDLTGDDSAESLLRQALALNPAHVQANFHLGRLLLNKRIAEGETFLDRAVAEDSEALLPACEVLFEYYRHKGDEGRLQSIRRRVDEHHATLAASERELREVTPSDSFLPHDLSPADLDPLRSLLRSRVDVLRAWLARKKLQHCTKQQLYVFSLDLQRPWHRLRNSENESRVLAEISAQLKLPGRVLVLSTAGPMKTVARKVRDCSTAL